MTNEKVVRDPADLKNLRAFSPIFVFLAGIFCACLVISNTIAGKLIWIDALKIAVPSAVLVFPIAYIFGDILTEVYGFRRSRIVIWTGFTANLIMALIYTLAVYLPAPPFQSADPFLQVLGMSPLVVVASLLGYFCGEFTNSAVLSQMKKFTKGRHLWMRTIGSTVFGEFVDSAIFITLVFSWSMPMHVVAQLVIVQYLLKVAYEIIATPLTYRIVGYIKRKERVDIYDYGESYNPFKIEG